MKIKIDADELTLNITELLEGMDLEARRDLAQSLAIDDDVFQAVADRICFGITDNGSWVGRCQTEEKARAYLVSNVSAAAKRLVKQLQHDAEQAKLVEKRMDEWAWKMYHAWPDEYLMQRPDWPPFACAARASDEVIQKVVDGMGL